MHLKHIILLGFKHVGKTLIGRQLANKLSKQFIDLDEAVEKFYAISKLESLNCRQIMQLHGEAYYRSLEADVLQQVVKLPACVIALGGGTSLNFSNQEIIKSHQLLHVVAPREIVFERIMMTGRPAFFTANEDPYESFSHLWDERNKVYQTLTTSIIDNSGSVEQAVNAAIHATTSF